MAFLLIVALAVLSVVTGKLTSGGGTVAAVISAILYIGLGIEGLVYLGIFFIAGVLATAHKKPGKNPLLTLADHGPRNVRQVLANGGVAAIWAILSMADNDLHPLMSLLAACSFASATADTLSSELGIIYGSANYNIITLKKDQRGLDGVVSIEGTLIGVLATFLIAVPYQLFFKTGYSFWIIVIAGTIGNYADSVLGATLERQNRLHNDVVNLLNTVIAAMAGLVLTMI